MRYQPNSLEVPVGSTVSFIFVNGYDSSHPVGFAPAVDFALASSGSNITYTYTYDKPGDYMFFCKIHDDSGLLRVMP